MSDKPGRRVTTPVGRWRIVEMDLWDKEDVDLLAPGFIEFDQDHGGSLGFIAVQGAIDWRETSRQGRSSLDFSWEGLRRVRSRYGAWLGRAGGGRIAARPHLLPPRRRFGLPRQTRPVTAETSRTDGAWPAARYSRASSSARRSRTAVECVPFRNRRTRHHRDNTVTARSKRRRGNRSAGLDLIAANHASGNEQPSRISSGSKPHQHRLGGTSSGRRRIYMPIAWYPLST